MAPTSRAHDRSVLRSATPSTSREGITSIISSCPQPRYNSARITVGTTTSCRIRVEDRRQVRPDRHRSKSRHSRSTRVAHRKLPNRRSRTRHDETQQLPSHLTNVPPDESGREHRTVHTHMRPRPRLTEHMGVFEQSPTPIPVTALACGSRFTQVLIDPFADLASESILHVSLLARARQRR